MGLLVISPVFILGSIPFPGDLISSPSLPNKYSSPEKRSRRSLKSFFDKLGVYPYLIAKISYIPGFISAYWPCLVPIGAIFKA